MDKNQDGTYTAKRLDVLASFRDMKNGGMFFLQDATFFSINSYTFTACKDGLIESITFRVEGEMPPSLDLAGNQRPVTKASIITDVKESATGKRVLDIRDLKLEVEEKKLKKELKSIEV